LIGKFHGQNLATYLKQVAQSVENYHSVDIFTVPLEGRSLRVAVLNVDSIAASNHGDPAVIRGIVDRSRRLASPFGGPAFLRQYYKHVQFGSLAWVVARVNPRRLSSGLDCAFREAGRNCGFRQLPEPAPFACRNPPLRAEAYTAAPDDAGSIADKANVFLALFRSAESSIGVRGTDADVKAFFEKHPCPTRARPRGIGRLGFYPVPSQVAGGTCLGADTARITVPTEKRPAKSR